MRTLHVLLALALVLNAGAATAQCPPQSVWPSAEWADRSADTQAARAAQITALETYAFTRTGLDEERLGIRTEGVVIVRGGELVYERYAPSHTAATRQLTWSVTKSFVNALTALAVREGKLALGDSICKHLGGETNCEITVGHLLEFSSGLDWKEIYENESNQASSVLAMLYGQGRGDMGEFTRTHALRDPPGTTFAYSSGESTLLAKVVGAAMESHGPDFPWTLLFEPIGITSAVWERDPKGTLVGGSYLYLTARDMARFGYLYLNDGCWNGQRLLPEGWVADSTVVTEAYRQGKWDPGEDWVQGRQFWLNRDVPEQNVTAPWPSIPADAYAASGHWGQSILIVPSLDMVIVRIGDDRERTFDHDTFFELAIAVGRAP